MQQSQADLRLVIEEDKVTGSYVYKTVDRKTGEIVAQIPREDVLQMRERSYAAGDLIRTRA
jgi:flagellar protein FlaG